MTTQTKSTLPGPAVYTPFDNGLYQVTAGLRPLDTSFGNGQADTNIFQIDSEFQTFRENRQRVRQRDFQRYCGIEKGAEQLTQRASAFIVEQLCHEYPNLFHSDTHENNLTLSCALTNETIQFTKEMKEAHSQSTNYRSAFDAICSQIQEDIAIVTVSEQGDRLVAAYVTAPNHWDPAQKLGLDFAAVHQPVAECEELNRAAPKLMKAMAVKGRHQRFVWGIARDRRLDHHPTPPSDFHGTPKEWRVTPFNPQAPKLYVRVERQVIITLPQASAFLFCIHPYFLDIATLSKTHRAALTQGLLSMTQASRKYKGLAHDFDHILRWLQEG